MDDTRSIKQYFKGKTIFLTGGTGFIGKALIEKLLRSCPDVEKIYLLIRPKKGKVISDRIEVIIKDPLFDLLKKTDPENLKKIVPVEGDTSQLGLGIKNDSRQLLIDEVEIFIHAAASIRFDDFLKEAIFLNLRSAREAAHLALEMKRIEVFMHVSTTYCNIEKRKVVEEVLYPPLGDWRSTIELAENYDTHILNILSQKYIEDFPNTYTYTKRLAEHCINDLLAAKIKTLIYRPSVVVSSYLEPYRGWLDNFYGPVGMIIAGNVGILRICYTDPALNIDFVCVDHSVKAMIVSIWYTGTNEKENSIAVYNGSKDDICHVPNSMFPEAGKEIRWIVPFERKIWFPDQSITKCWYYYYINVLLFHMLPAFFIDIMLKIAGFPQMLWKIQRKVYITSLAVEHFMFNEWKFINKKLVNLVKFIPKKEFDEFYYLDAPQTKQEIINYFSACADVARRKLLHEGDITENGRFRTKVMYYLNLLSHWAFYAGVAWLTFYKINIVEIVYTAITNYFKKL